MHIIDGLRPLQLVPLSRLHFLFRTPTPAVSEPVGTRPEPSAAMGAGAEASTSGSGSVAGSAADLQECPRHRRTLNQGLGP